MIRKQIYITQEQNEQLKREAARRRVSEAALIRYGIDGLVVKDTERQAAWEQLLADMRARSKLKVPQGKRTWTRDELYDERFRRH